MLQQGASHCMAASKFAKQHQSRAQAIAWQHELLNNKARKVANGMRGHAPVHSRNTRCAIT